MLGEAEAHTTESAVGESAGVGGQSEALLAEGAVETLSKAALSSRVGLFVPGIGVEGDAGPQEGDRETDDEPAVLGVDGILRIPAELV